MENSWGSVFMSHQAQEGQEAFLLLLDIFAAVDLVNRFVSIKLLRCSESIFLYRLKKLKHFFFDLVISSLVVRSKSDEASSFWIQ